MSRLIAWCVLATLPLALLGTQPQAVAPLQRLIDGPVDVRLPVHICSVPSTVGTLARRGYLVAGIEYLSGDCNVEWSRQTGSTESVGLAGLTLEAALNKLIELDSRYQWLDADGVVLLRPVADAADPQNWLNHTAAAFDLDDQNAGAALFKIASAVTGDDRVPQEIGMRTELGQRKLSVHLQNVSVADTLNAIVREHGAAWWEARDHARVSEHQEDRMLWIYTHDGAGLGVTTKRYVLNPKP